MDTALAYNMDIHNYGGANYVSGSIGSGGRDTGCHCFGAVFPDFVLESGSVEFTKEYPVLPVLSVSCGGFFPGRNPKCNVYPHGNGFKSDTLFGDGGGFSQ